MTITYLERPVYELGQVDALLGLGHGTARRWVDGYERRGQSFEPVVRETSTGNDLVTWGEFVETRLLASYRDSGVPMLRMRPIVEGLREQFGVRNPLATLRTYVDESRQLVYELQEQEGLEDSMRLVVEAASGHLVFSTQMRQFERTMEFGPDDGNGLSITVRIKPPGRARALTLDPERRSGQPVARSVPTDVLVELVRAHEPIEWVAEQYELSVEQVLDALEYERRLVAA